MSANTHIFPPSLLFLPSLVVFFLSFNWMDDLRRVEKRRRESQRGVGGRYLHMCLFAVNVLCYIDV